MHAVSGLEINRMKSEAMWFGSKQNCTDTLLGRYARGDSKYLEFLLLLLFLPVTNVLLKLKRTVRKA